MRVLRLVVLASLLGGGGIVSVKAQTLAQVLTAIQKRKELLQDRSNVGKTLNDSVSDDYYLDVIDQSPPQPIKWDGVSKSEPGESDIAGLSIGTKFKLVKQAWSELLQMESRFDESRQIAGGLGYLNSVDFGPDIYPVTPNNYRRLLQILSQRVVQLNMLAWPAVWKQQKYKYDSNELTSEPKTPLPLSGTFDSSGPGASVASVGRILIHGYTSAGVRADAQGTYPDISYTYTQTYRCQYDIDNFTFESNGSNIPAGGKLQLFTDFGYVVNRMKDLPKPTATGGGVIVNPYIPLNEECAMANVSSGASVSWDSTNTFGLSGISFPGQIDLYEGNSPLYQPGYYYFTEFVPEYLDQNNSVLWTSAYDHRSVGFVGLDWGDQQIAVNGSTSDDYWYSSGNQYGNTDSLSAVATAINGGIGGVLTFQSIYTADFGAEFGPAKISPPEEIGTLQLIPNFKDGELKITLAKTPANECALVWRFPERIQTAHQTLTSDFGSLSARYVLQAQGCGKWDAVYSGDPTDREAELQWKGANKNLNGRWPNYESYIKEYWRPVLKQLVCATYAVNISQTDPYTYQIDFYRRDQVVAKDPTTGKYTFPATGAIDTFIVSNPKRDDALTGVLEIVVHKGQANQATYDLTLTQQLDDVQNVAKSDWLFTGPDISKEVIVSPPSVDRSGTTITLLAKEVVDTTTLGGGTLPKVELPKVTTTYWEWPLSLVDVSESEWPNPLPKGEWIDTVTESSSVDGTRTTTYTYNSKDVELVPDSGQKYREIDCLTGIVQTGGSNPYTATYDSAEQLLTYSDTYGGVEVSYTGNKVTRVEKMNGQPVRTLETTYSGDMSQATTIAK